MKRFAIEKLEDRIAPSFVFLDGSQPDDAGASPPGPRGDGTFGPSSVDFPSNSDHAPLAAWNAHDQSPVLGNGGT